MFSVRNLFESLNRSNIDYIDFYDNEFELITTIVAGNIIKTNDNNFRR